MALLVIFLVILSLPSFAQSECYYGTNAPPVLYFTQQEGTKKTVAGFKTKLESACFGRKDISSWITDSKDGVVTSSIQPYKNKAFFYVTTYNQLKNESKIIAVYQSGDGRPMKKTLMAGNKNHNNTRLLFTRMLIEGYDVSHGVIYFSVPVSATNEFIYAFNVPRSSFYALDKIRPRFIAEGNFKYLNVLSGKCEGCLVVTATKFDEAGAYFPVLMFDRKGVLVCQLDNRGHEFGVLPCLPEGKSYKPRQTVEFSRHFPSLDINATNTPVDLLKSE
ncbi:hypothetical protein ACTVKO_23875 [Serratia nevei]|uniref:hypothetical protein n=1 Tax=Serratia nevei TaxID=2703794 RepID=UPI003FA7E86A